MLLKDAFRPWLHALNVVCCVLRQHWSSSCIDTCLCMVAGAFYTSSFPLHIVMLCTGNAQAPRHFLVPVEVSSNEQHIIPPRSSIHAALGEVCLAGFANFSCRIEEWKVFWYIFQYEVRQTWTVFLIHACKICI